MGRDHWPWPDVDPAVSLQRDLGQGRQEGRVQPVGRPRERGSGNLLNHTKISLPIPPALVSCLLSRLTLELHFFFLFNSHLFVLNRNRGIWSSSSNSPRCPGTSSADPAPARERYIGSPSISFFLSFFLFFFFCIATNYIKYSVCLSD